jgi:hypothetical protein
MQLTVVGQLVVGVRHRDGVFLSVGSALRGLAVALEISFVVQVGVEKGA